MLRPHVSVQERVNHFALENWRLCFIFKIVKISMFLVFLLQVKTSDFFACLLQKEILGDHILGSSCIVWN